mmetsp:Transcript_4698/g.10017  ORF Transcript_4698/g.10017 Transcript_4698/m.10017 type:complete len:617 (-) Transcript_4698:165-2015(-)|eukprot:CAMPEP_0172468222 /NCGR_PEP_ID=MMETSP1065-20121228/60865_1 /TAXON_ID=265537 /ORGANISM="Amphiprora paludosa, Strain CCMP125" /LENGTH=616 /DNA_ID=CAMNT_0013225575 /DNA_START=24 /DNA_END=1874 /DNA_ORIENTATION=-
MKIALSILVGSSLLATASALHGKPDIDSTNGRFPVESESGQKLLRRAKVLEEPVTPRRLDGEDEELQLGNMFFKFEGCSTYQDRGIDYYEYWQNYRNQKNYQNWQNQQKSYQDWLDEQEANKNAYDNWKYNNNNANNNADYNAEYNNYNAQQQYYNVYNNEQQEDQVEEEEQQQDAYNGNNRHLYDYNNYQGEEGAEGNDQALEWVHLVRFTLCYDNGCNACTGKYAISMAEFLQAWWEHQTLINQYVCAQVRQYCACNNANYNQNNANYNQEYYQYQQQKCYNDCYKQAGQTSCISNDGQDNDGEEGNSFDLSEYLECSQQEYYPQGYAYYQMNKQNVNGNYDNAQDGNAGYYVDPNDDNMVYYIGPYCKENSGIYLQAFTDNACEYPAEHFVFKSKYSTQKGNAFPYMKSPILKENDCISCQDEEEYYEGMQEAQQEYQQYQYEKQYYNKYQQQQKNYQRYNDWNGDAEEEEKTSNELCGLSQDGEDVIKCVYSAEADEDMLQGCLFLDVLPELDGRNERARSGLNNILNIQENYTTALAVIAIVLGSVVAALCLCDPTKIRDTSMEDSKSASLLGAESARTKDGLVVGRDIRDEDSVMVEAPSVSVVEKATVA